MPCCDDWEYEAYGNQGNGDYEYNSYSDHYEPDHTPTEPNHYNPDPDHSEPDHYKECDDLQYHDDPDYGNGTDQWETEGEVHEHEGYKPFGFKYGGDEAHEHRELVYDNNGTGTDWEQGYEGAVEGNEVNEHRELTYNDDELCELEELKWMANEEGYEPQGPKYHNNGALGTSGKEYEYDDDNDARAFAPAGYNIVEHLSPPTRYNPTPTYVPPISLSLSPAPIPFTRGSPNSYQ
jgi:hypothetical protein